MHFGFRWQPLQRAHILATTKTPSPSSPPPSPLPRQRIYSFCNFQIHLFSQMFSSITLCFLPFHCDFSLTPLIRQLSSSLTSILSISVALVSLRILFCFNFVFVFRNHFILFSTFALFIAAISLLYGSDTNSPNVELKRKKKLFKVKIKCNGGNRSF